MTAMFEVRLDNRQFSDPDPRIFEDDNATTNQRFLNGLEILEEQL